VDFFSTLSLDAPHAHLAAKGELDAFAAVQLRHRLDEAVDRGYLHFTIDASAVTFVDAGGLGALVRLTNNVAPLGGTVAVTAASPRFRQVVELVGLAHVLGVDLLADAPSPHAQVVPIGRRVRLHVGQRLSVVPPAPCDGPASRAGTARSGGTAGSR
jgi:anti-sigma B factor antagonist